VQKKPSPQIKFKNYAAQYIGCQHHILDRILRHVLDYYNPTTLTKPSFNYEFVDDVINNYNSLLENYKPDTTMKIVENPGFRDDFKYLFVLCAAFRFHKTTGRYPNIKWLKLPSLNNARWNSRATNALISYFLIPKWRIALEAPCSFIANAWQEAWFSNYIFKEDVYNNLLQSISQLNCPAALTSFTTHWISEKSVLNIPHTNILQKERWNEWKNCYRNAKKRNIWRWSLYQLINFEWLY